MCLLLPAVQAAREAARMSACANNMRQLGLAVLGYEEQKQRLPSHSFDYGLRMGSRRTWGTSTTDAAERDFWCSWGVMPHLTPFLEEADLYQKLLTEFDTGKNFWPSETLLETNPKSRRLALLLCPSEIQRRPLLSIMGLTSYHVNTGDLLTSGMRDCVNCFRGPFVPGIRPPP